MADDAEHAKHFMWMYADFGWRMGLSKKNPERWSNAMVFDTLLRNIPDEELEKRTVLVRRLRPGSKSFIHYDDEQVFKDKDTIIAHFGTNQVVPLGRSKSAMCEEDLHHFAADCSAKIYDDPQPEWAFSPTGGTGVCGVLLNEKNTAICIVFRGTATVFDCAADLKCKIKDGSALKPYGIGVQDNFWTEVEDSSDDIYEKMINLIKEKNLEPSSLQLIITGHSYGGGCAMLLHALVYHKRQQREWPCAEDPSGVEGLLDRCRCVVFAAPMVFALPEKEKDLTDEYKARRGKFSTHIERTTCNYVFYDDPVPRAYGFLQADQFLQFVVGALDQSFRIAGQKAGGGAVLAGGGAAALVGCLSVLCPGVAVGVGCSVLFAGATSAAASVVISKKVEGLKAAFGPQAMAETVRIYERFAKRYKACGKYRLLHGGQKTWTKYNLNLDSFAHHSMVGYKDALRWRMEHSLHHETIESFNLDTQAVVTAPEATLKENLQNMAEALYEQAKEDRWDQLTSMLSEVDHGFIESISLKRDCHFIHQAAYYGNLKTLFQLMEFGANPARKSQSKRTIRDLVNERTKNDDTTKELVGWLCDYAEDLEKQGCVASDIASKSAAAMERFQKDGEKVKPDESLVKTNAMRLGYTEVQIKVCQMEVGNKGSYDELVSLLRKKYPRQLDIEQAHRFLDHAKYGPVDNYKGMLEILEANRKFATVGRTEELSNRWTALMQVTYNNGPMDVIRKLLVHYPDVNAIRKAMSDLQAVQQEIQSELVAASPAKRSRGEAVPASPAGHRGSFGAPSTSSGYLAPPSTPAQRRGGSRGGSPSAASLEASPAQSDRSSLASVDGAPPGQNLNEIKTLLERIAAEVDKGGQVKEVVQKV